MRSAQQLTWMSAVCVVIILIVVVDNWFTLYLIDEKGNKLMMFDKERAIGAGLLDENSAFFRSDRSNEYTWTTGSDDLGVVVFPNYMFGFSIVRIPALVYHNGVYIAFCELRAETHGDAGDMSIIARRGRRNWGNEIQWEKPILVAMVPGMRVMCPVPIVDRKRDTIVMTFVAYPPNVTESQMRKKGVYDQAVMVTKSKDNGVSWSEPVDITATTLAAMKPLPSMFASGPGHGIQLRSGRLIVPGNVQVRSSKVHFLGLALGNRFVYQLSTVLYSDNGGDTWHPGGYVPMGLDIQGKYILTNEAQAAELTDNVVCLNSRTPNAHQTRAISCSENGGLTFQNPQLSDNLVEPGFSASLGILLPQRNPGCQGSMVTFPAPPGTNITEDVHDTWALFSNPANMAKRSRLSIRISTNSLRTWSEPWRIVSGSSAYSDLTYFETTDYGQTVQNFAILYEIGLLSKRQIAFRTFTLDDVMRNIPIT